jgi:cobalt-zinc-cadmium efflux system membrane fusion protein
MKRLPAVVAGVAAVGVLLAGGGWLTAWLQDHRPATPEPVAASRTGDGSLVFATSAPQLAFIGAEQAVLDAEPLLDALPGRVTYDEDRTARINAPLAGRVDRILVSLGDRVRRGTALAILDAPEFAQALADLKRDELEIRQRRRVFERATLLFEGGVMPRREYESAETDLREAEVELTRAQRRLQALAPGVATDAAGLVLRSPVDGVVTERSINPGTLVGPDKAEPLFVVSDPSSVRVVVDVPEQHIAALREGQKVSLEVDAYPGRRFAGTVAHVADVLNPATRRIQVRCRVANPERLLKPEMYARVSALAEGDRSRVRIPASALITLGVGTYVFVEEHPGRFVRRGVEVSTQGRDTVYLQSGIQAGERVVARGALLLNSELQGE